MRNVMFWSPCIYLFIYLYACYSHNSKSIKQNRMTFGGMIGYYPGTIWLDFGVKGQGQGHKKVNLLFTIVLSEYKLTSRQHNTCMLDRQSGFELRCWRRHSFLTVWTCNSTFSSKHFFMDELLVTLVSISIVIVSKTKLKIVVQKTQNYTECHDKKVWRANVSFCKSIYCQFCG